MKKSYVYLALLVVLTAWMLAGCASEPTEHSYLCYRVLGPYLERAASAGVAEDAVFQLDINTNGKLFNGAGHYECSPMKNNAGRLDGR
jgi:hypothetical protein